MPGGPCERRRTRASPILARAFEASCKPQAHGGRAAQSRDALGRRRAGQPCRTRRARWRARWFGAKNPGWGAACAEGKFCTGDAGVHSERRGAAVRRRRDLSMARIRGESCQRVETERRARGSAAHARLASAWVPHGVHACHVSSPGAPPCLRKIPASFGRASPEAIPAELHFAERAPA